MRNQTLPIALLIAAAVLPVSGCGDSGSAQAQTASTDPSGTDNASPLPLDQADPPPPAQPSLADQVKSLSQALDAQQKQADHRFTKQTQHIDQLEQTVDQLRARLRRLPSPQAFDKLTAQLKASSQPSDSAPADASSNVSGGQDTHPAPLEPTTAHGASPSASDQAAVKDPDKGPNDSDPHGGDPADTVCKIDTHKPAPSAKTPATPAGSPNKATPVQCPEHTATDQFDVFFQPAGNTGLNQARAAVKKAQMHDWFATADRLYVGRYGTCPLAEHRQTTVHAQTGLPLRIAAVERHRAGHKPRHTTDHPYRKPAAPPRASAPFEIIGVEQRGTHHYLGVARQGATHPSQIIWLSPGETFAGWRLTGIHGNRDTATFVTDGRAVSVALPSGR